MQKNIDPNKINYLKLIIELSDEIGISLEEARNLVNASLYFINPKEINYQKLKEKILIFVVMNIFSLIYKL